MLNDQDMTDLRRSSTRLDGVDADTHITVNPPATPSIRPPEFTLPPAPTTPTSTVISEQVVPAGEPAYHAPKITTRTTHQVNWGKVVKGVATVAAVAVVGVAAFYLIGGVVSGFVAEMGAQSAVAGAFNTVSSGATGAVGVLADYTSYALTTAGDFLAGAGHALFGSSAASVATTTSLTAAQSTAIGHGTAALAVGGAAAIGAPMIKSVLATPMIDTVHQTVSTPDPAGFDDGGASLVLPMKKNVLANQAAQASQLDAATGVDAHGHEEALAQKYASTSSKMAHHAGEHMAAADNLDMPDAPEEEQAHQRSREILRRTAQQSKAWADRAQSNHYSQTLAQTGSHADAVRAHATERSTPAPRDGFAAELNKERAALDAALEPAR